MNRYSSTSDRTAHQPAAGPGLPDMRNLYPEYTRQKNHAKQRTAEDLQRVRELISYDPETGELRWRVQRCKQAPAGSVLTYRNGSGYIASNIRGLGTVRGHHIAWALLHGEWPVGQIDHINGVRDDNRAVNLRQVLRSALNQQNLRRKRKDSKQPYMGFSLSARSSRQ